MKKINKILRTSIIALILVLLMQITVFADTLNINIKDDEFYIVNYETSEVIYSEGYTDLDKNTVYKLSEMQNISKNK